MGLYVRYSESQVSGRVLTMLRQYSGRNVIETSFITRSAVPITGRVNHDRLAAVLAVKQLSPIESAACGARHFKAIQDMERRVDERRERERHQFSEV